MPEGAEASLNVKLQPLHPYEKCPWGMCQCRNRLEGCRCGGARCKHNGNISGPDGMWCIECCPKVIEVPKGPSAAAAPVLEGLPRYSVVEYPADLVPPDGFVEVAVGVPCLIHMKREKVTKYSASRNAVGKVWRFTRWLIVTESARACSSYPSQQVQETSAFVVNFSCRCGGGLLDFGC